MKSLQKAELRRELQRRDERLTHYDTRCVDLLCGALIGVILHNGFSVAIFGISPWLLLTWAVMAPFYCRFWDAKIDRRHASKQMALHRSRVERDWEPDPPRGEPVMASTGCELTDQIFAAAREAGINPIDVIGPEKWHPSYAEWLRKNQLEQ